MIKILVTTINRKDNYIDKLISSFQSSCDQKLILMVDSTDTSYLKKYRNNKNIEIRSLSQSENDNLKNILPHQRIYEVQQRCLTSNIISDEGILIIEDDVIFSKNWYEKFLLSVKEIKAVRGDDFILSLFTSRGFPLDKAGTHIYNYPYSSYAGAHAMFYPNKIRTALVEYYKEFSKDKKTEEKLYHSMISQFIQKNNTPLFITIPCLVQHIGKESTWYPSQFSQRAISFDP